MGLLNRATVSALTTGVLVGATACWWALSHRVSQGESVSTTLAPTHAGRTGPDTAATVSAAVAQSLPTPNTLPTATTRTPEDVLAETKRAFEDPAWLEQARTRARARIEMTKGRMLQRLASTSAADKERLTTLLAEADVRLQRAALPPRVDASAAELQAVSEGLVRLQAERDAQVRALLTADDFALYTADQQSEAYRGSVEQIANVMRARGATLSDDLQDTLLDGYAAALLAAAHDATSDAGMAQFQSLNDAQRADLRRKQAARVDRYLATTMGQLLGPEDYRLFVEAQRAQEPPTP